MTEKPTGDEEGDSGNSGQGCVEKPELCRGHFFEKAADYVFLTETQLRRFVEGLCEYARQYYHRPLRLDDVVICC